MLKEFAARNQEGALKTKPKGWDADHRDIALLKLRNFTVSKKIDDAIFTAEDAVDKVLGLIQPMIPFVSESLPHAADFGPVALYSLSNDLTRSHS